jgi:hypothetical protein
MKKAFFACCLLFSLAALNVVAAPSFRVNRNYSNLGLSIRTLGGAEPEPLPQPHIYSYTFTRSGESVKRDLFDPYELWYATQHVGQWRDGNDNLLILGRPSRRLPAFDAETKHVAREAFDEAIDAPASAFDPADPQALAEWAAAFAACTLGAPENVRTGFNLSDALFFPVETSATLVYAFRAKGRAPNGQTAPTDWFCAVVKIADSTPKAKVRKDFETQFLATVSALPQTGARPAAAAPSKAASAAAVPDHPGRAAAHKSIANMQGWWYADTPEYTFLTDIRSATGQRLIRELQSMLPALRKAFVRLVPPFGSEADINVVRIFEESDAYKKYVGETIEWSVGCWMPSRRELVILSQGKDRDQTLEIIRHEGFHQYLFYATGRAQNAMWFNEGHACFFEAAQVDSKGRVELPEDGRVNHLLDNLEAAAANIPSLLQADHAAFYSGAGPKRQLNYTTAWALVYFLRKGAPSQRLAAYENVLPSYLKTLAETKDCEAATAAAFEGIDMKKLQKDFIDCWKNSRNAARRYDPLAEGTGNAQRPTLNTQR